MLEWFGTIVVDNVFGYILDQSSLGEQIRSKIAKEPAKDAFQRSLEQTFAYIESQHPYLAAQDFFRKSFQEQKCTLILAKLLLRDKQIDPLALASLWAETRYKQSSAEYASAVHSFEPIAITFLGYLDKELRKEAALQAIYDSQALEHMTTSIDSLVNHLVPTQLSAEDIAKQSQHYCEKLYHQSKMLDFRGIQHHRDANTSVSIPLINVFVLPDVHAGIPEYETLERDESETDGKQKNKQQEIGDVNERERRTRSRHRQIKSGQILSQRTDLKAVLTKYHQLVILGDPGSGKSMLLKYLMLILAQDMTRSSKEFQQLVVGTQVTSPFYIPLSTYAEMWRSPNIEDHSLGNFLSKYLHLIYLGSYTQVMQKLLEQGKLLILLDGLDEIPDASLRIQIVRQIEIFTQAYPQNHFIVTSRIVGYRDAPLTEDYQAYTLADFSEEQIKAFTRKWCPAYEHWVKHIDDNQLLHDAATKEADKLFQATHQNEGVKRLAVNPLLLTILAIIQRQGIELPSHRVELYELCVETLLETWLRTKGPNNKPYFSKSDFIKILRPLAFWMHEHPSVGAIPENELLEQVVKQLLTRKIVQNEYEAQVRAEQFLYTIREKTGILIERGRQRYGFLHLTFEEFFAALELEVRRKDRDEFIKKHLHDSRWRVVILLTIGIIGILRSDEEEVTELIQNAVLNANSRYENWLYRDLLLAGMCLADDIGVSIECENAIINKVTYIYLTSPFDALHSAFDPLWEAWRNTPIATKVCDAALTLLRYQREQFATPTSPATLVAPNLATNELLQQMTLYYQKLDQQNREVLARKLRLYIITALSFTTNITHMLEESLKALSDESFDVRLAAIAALGHMGTGQLQAIEALLPLLSDKDHDMRQATATALGHIGNGQSQVCDALLPLLSDKELPDVRLAVIDALGQIGNGQPQVTKALLNALSDWRIRQAVVDALEQIGCDQLQIIEALLAQLSDIDGSLRQVRAHALGLIGNGQPQAVDVLLPLLSNKDWSMRQIAIIVLGRIAHGHPLVVDALLPLLSDDDSPAICQATADALGRIGKGQTQVIDALLPLLSDDHPNVRHAAACALGHIGKGLPLVVDALLTLLSDDDSPAIHQATIDALGQIGNGQPLVFDALLPLLSDDNFNVCEAAARALGQISSAQPLVEHLLTILAASSPPTTFLPQQNRDHARLKLHRQLLASIISLLGLIGKGQPQVAEALFPLLSDDNFAVCQFADDTLARIGKGEPLIIEHLLNMLTATSLPQQNRDHTKQKLHSQLLASIISLLGRIGKGQPLVIDALLPLLSDPAPNVRQIAPKALGLLGNGQPQVIDALLPLLSDPASNVRQATTDALRLLGKEYPLIVDALIPLLSDPASHVRQAAANALGLLGNGQPQVINAFLPLLSDPASHVRHVAVYALGLLGNGQPQVIDVLLPLLSDPVSLIRLTTANALGLLGNRQTLVVDVLLPWLSDPVSHIRLATANALGLLGNGQPQVIDALIPLLSDPVSHIRLATANALGLLGKGQPLIVAALLPLLPDPVSHIRQAAARALGLLGNGQPLVIDALLPLLSDDDYEVREAAVYALGRIGNEQSHIVEALLPLLADPAFNVRQTVFDVLNISSNAQVGSFVEKMLLKYDSLVDKSVVDGLIHNHLLFFLQQVIGEKQMDY